MMLSSTCKYAIRAIIYLGLNNKEGERIGIKVIAEDLNMPSPFLGKIMQTLAKNKVLTSTKGPHGGFALYKKPEDISVLSIIDIFDGLDLFDECVIGLKICEKKPEYKNKCVFGKKVDPLINSFKSEFENQTLANFMNDYKEVGHFI